MEKQLVNVSQLRKPPNLSGSRNFHLHIPTSCGPRSQLILMGGLWNRVYLACDFFACVELTEEEMESEGVRVCPQLDQWLGWVCFISFRHPRWAPPAICYLLTESVGTVGWRSSLCFDELFKIGLKAQLKYLHNTCQAAALACINLS